MASFLVAMESVFPTHMYAMVITTVRMVVMKKAVLVGN